MAFNEADLTIMASLVRRRLNNEKKRSVASDLRAVQENKVRDLERLLYKITKEKEKLDG